jgi:hypothetical protein
MKNSSKLFLMAFVLFAQVALAQEISPYILVGESTLSLQETEAEVKQALQGQGFEVIGSYHPENNQTLKVVAYTRNDLKNATIQVKDRGALASVLKVGLKTDGPGTKISYLNPEYLFQAYLMDAYDKHASTLKKVEADAMAALSPLGTVNKGFGGVKTAKQLREYHYKMMMPYFTDPVELKEFSSFEEGVKTIEQNLKTKKGNTLAVYSVKFPSEQVAVFGIGLLDAEDGEKYFLPVIGEDHLAAMPYEIILQGKEATMLNGKYRLALHWPELTMGTFMKISGTPGDIKDFMKELCE